MADHKVPIGANITSEGVHFRVWAPRRERVTVVFEGAQASASVELQSEANGYFAALVPGIEAGTLYRFRLDNDERLYPDPMSRFQPEGPHGPSQVVDPRSSR